jgi:hypothetical protein
MDKVLKKKIILSEEQTNALNNIFYWWFNNNSISRVLKGYAGTGKTTLVSHLIKHGVKVPKNGSNHTLKIEKYVMAAPTHKAAFVLSEKTGEKVSTLHSLLGLSPAVHLEIFDDADPLYAPSKGSSIPDNCLVIVDECSMINKNLKMFLEKICISLQSRILYIGDPAQIPPIGEELSDTFLLEGDELIEIRRTEEGSILQSCAYLRENVKNRDLNLYGFKDDRFRFEKLGKDIVKYYEEDKITTKYIAWTNERVSAANISVRNHLIKSENKFAEGDIIVTMETRGGLSIDKPFFSGYMNCEEFEIIEIKEWIQEYNGNSHEKISLSCYLLTCNSLLIKNKVCEILILKKDSYTNFINYYSYLVSLAKKESEPTKRAKKWGNVLTLKSTILVSSPISYKNDNGYYYKKTVDYAYAITSHKSQGSTYKRVIIDIEDIMKNKDEWERNRILYVAISRASEEVIVVY